MGLHEDNIQITVTKIENKLIFLDVYLEEVPRLMGFTYKGVKNRILTSLTIRLIIARQVVNENLKAVVKNIIRNYYIDKGYYFTQVEIEEERDSSNHNLVTLIIDVKKGKKTRINEIIFHGTEQVEPIKLYAAMKETKAKFIFRPFNKIDTAIVDFFKNHDKYKGKI